MTDPNVNDHLLSCTTDIVAAYVAGNPIAREDLATLIQQVYKTLSSIDGPGLTSMVDRPQPAVPIKKSVTPDYIVCLEDGRKLKMLKRHLQTAYGMSPESYRERWGLPADYPMVAPNYARKRSNLAKDIGLGTRGKKRAKR